MKIGFVFTNYNNSDYTSKCLQSISEITQPLDYFVVVVDNKSNLENLLILKNLKEKYKSVHFIFNDENAGYFSGLNIGISYLKNSGVTYDYLIIGNNDLLFPKNFFESLLKSKKSLDTYAVVSPNIITLDNVHQNPHVIKNISKFREMIYDLYYSNYYVSVIISYLARITRKFTDRSDEKSHDIPQTIYQGYGACYILGPLFFENFEMLWAPTFLMGEELFISLQLKEKGLNIFYEPKIIITHYDHASVGTLPSKKLWSISKKSHKIYRKYVKVFN